MDESSQSKLTRRFSDHRKMDIKETKLGLDFMRESESIGIGIGNGKRFGNPSSQELTLSYLCDSNNNKGSAKHEFLEKDFPGKPKTPFLSSYKGKEVLGENEDEKWIERDFLNLNNPSSKREIDRNEDEEEEEEEEEEESNREKRPKLSEALSLSLALPEVSLSLTPSNALQVQSNNNNNNNININSHQGDMKPSRSVQSLTYNSNDYTAAASLSYSYSHQFSHNPSCSLTRNSTENFDDPIWNCGEGTNGSVHSRFKPVGEGLVGLYSLMQQGSTNTNNNCNKKDSENSLSFFPSDLPARPVRIDNNSINNNNNNIVSQSGSESFRGFEGLDRNRKKLSKPERLLREIVSESVPTIAQTIQELSEETIVFTKEHLRSLITGKKDELYNLQARLERRSDLTKETLSKCHKDQLEIMVAVKMGLLSFLATKNRLPSDELVEIFLLKRCRNVNCKSSLPVDDCDCKICSGNGGFCSSCMCPVCLSFDCASNTCSWVGCDVCSHWCHAECGLQRGLIGPGRTKGSLSGGTEIQFHCLGCGHASEMFGFVKEVFLCCAKDWGLDTLIKELDCVRKIFKGSDDFKGKELHGKAGEIISKLGSKSVSPKDAVSFITQFFNYADRLSEFTPGVLSKDLVVTTTTSSQVNLRKDSAPLTNPQPVPAKYIMSPTLQPRDMLPSDLRQSDLKPSPVAASSGKDFRFGSDTFESLESVVRVKEAEARMFQTKADEALREAEEYHRMIRATTEKLDSEYSEKLEKLRLRETEDRRRKKLEELKMLENSHCDYYNMKMRMQGEIAGLLERMEATKKQWV